MSDSLRPDRARALDAAQERDAKPDRDAKIEQLLLLGLDHYFVAQYDHAINVWTRALFLDRSHARARAYIERARSALAERQRKSEELLHTGVAAFERGDGREARRLLREAIDGGAPSDEALAVLERINRLEAPAPIDPPAMTGRRRRRLAPSRVGGSVRPHTGFWLTLSAMAILASATYVAVARGTLDLRAWLTDLPLSRSQGAGGGAPLAGDMELPLPRRGEAALVRARALTAGGHLRDALAILDIVRATDPQKPDADRLRADIQRQLLALAAPVDTLAAESEPAARRAP